MSRLVASLSLIALLPALSGCATAIVGAAGATAVTATQERSFGEALDDAAVSNEIKSKLISNGGLSEVDVEVAAGVVLLSGRVWTPELRLKAESLAWSVRRADDVANEIRVEAPGGFFANASDELISTRVRARLLGSSSVQANNFNVETYGGTVYLLGVARSAQELEQAAEEASKVGGVNQVVSYVRLRNERGEIVPYTPAQPAAVDAGELLGGPGS
ncbi:MAG: BON domain-containing protein [Hyphomonas sp.]|jgi:osmotically-inducible protein OsmY|nr:BON domain-containing protein [Alphaproteobacteria bacterium]MCR9223484.1 BON domain-containing protein [Hyphomonas sp.]